MENHRSLSPLNLVVEILGDKWTLLILRDLILENKRYFSEFYDSEEKISSNILSDRLAMLEHRDLISKKLDRSNRQKAIYSLTERSIDLLPVLIEAIIWSLKYKPVDVVKYKPAVDLIVAGNEAREEMRARLIGIHLSV